MIKVNEDYFIEADEKCYTLKLATHKQGKNGNELYNTIGYYKTLESALSGAVEHANRQKLKADVSLLEAITIVRDGRKQLEDLLKKVLNDGRC